MSSMCARLWPVGRPASRPRAPVEATHEGSLQLHTRHHIVDRGAGGTVSRSIRERFPGTRRGSLHDYEGSRFSGGSSTFTHCGTPVPFSGTQTRIHFCNGALRRRPPTQLPHSVRTCATSSHLAHAPPTTSLPDSHTCGTALPAAGPRGREDRRFYFYSLVRTYHI